MKWIKLLKIVIIIIVMILVGGLLYETISGHFTIRARDSVITELRADYKRISIRLDDAKNRVVDLQESVGEYKRRSEELGRQLRASQDRAAELADLYRVLAEENRRLGEAISHSSVAAGSIAEHSKLLGESIDRAWGILEQYTIPTGSE